MAHWIFVPVLQLLPFSCFLHYYRIDVFTRFQSKESDYRKCLPRADCLIWFLASRHQVYACCGSGIRNLAWEKDAGMRKYSSRFACFNRSWLQRHVWRCASALWSNRFLDLSIDRLLTLLGGWGDLQWIHCVELSMNRGQSSCRSRLLDQLGRAMDAHRTQWRRRKFRRHPQRAIATFSVFLYF